MLTINSLIAQVPVYPNQAISGIGPLGLQYTIVAGCTPILLLADTISKIVGFLTVVAFLWFTFQVVTGGIQWIISEGDKAGLKLAQDKILNAIIGLIITIASIFIVILISSLLGIKGILFLSNIAGNLIPTGSLISCP